VRRARSIDMSYKPFVSLPLEVFTTHKRASGNNEWNKLSTIFGMCDVEFQLRLS